MGKVLGQMSNHYSEEGEEDVKTLEEEVKHMEIIKSLSSLAMREEVKNSFDFKQIVGALEKFKSFTPKVNTFCEKYISNKTT